MKIFLAAIMIVSFSVSVKADSHGQETWGKLSREAKRGFVLGVITMQPSLCMNTAVEVHNKLNTTIEKFYNECMERNASHKFSFDAIVSEIDRLYGIKEFKDVPLMFVYGLAMRTLRGEDYRDLVSHWKKP